MPEQRLQRTREAYADGADHFRRAIESVRTVDIVELAREYQRRTSPAYRITQAQLAADLHAGEE